MMSKCEVFMTMKELEARAEKLRDKGHPTLGWFEYIAGVDLNDTYFIKEKLYPEKVYVLRYETRPLRHSHECVIGPLPSIDVELGDEWLGKKVIITVEEIQ